MATSLNPLPIPLLKIIFKNVGQGDTIILEWQKNKTTYVGIVDCKMNEDGSNPVVEYLEALNGNFKLHFIILSHPHKDHCIGILQLFDYIEEKGIIVHRFHHTFNADPAYLDKSAEKNGWLVKKIRRRADNLELTGHIEAGGFMSLGTTVQVHSKIGFFCLSPSQREFSLYQRRINYMSRKAVEQGQAAANYLSSIICVKAGHFSILLTADAEKGAFDRLLLRHKKELDQQFGITQVPHHGSAKNFNKSFWEKLPRVKDCVAVISVGNNEYKHPSAKVLDTLYDIDYRPHCTNEVHGAKAFYKKTKLPIVRNKNGDLLYEIF